MNEKDDVAESEGDTSVEAACPTPTAHKRLHEGHRWWHGCLESYDDPQEFQVNLNACLQALRNVTWVLQKEHDLVPGFDDWYPDWQQRMRNDPLMRWLVNSRNRVVKSGDLELHSTAHLRLIGDYYQMADAFDDGMPGRASAGETKRSMPPRTRPSEYRRYLASIPSRVLENSIILVERRWVDKALPDREILDALAHCYGVLSKLLADAHDRARGTGISPASLMHEGRLPCMVTTLDARTANYRFTDGSLVNAQGRGIGEISDLREKAARRYKGSLAQLIAAVPNPKSAIDFVDPIFEHAKIVLSKDKVHSHITMLYRGTTLLDVRQNVFADRADKFVFAQYLAKAVLLSGADGVITIGELWESRAVFDEDGVPIPPAEVPDRWEALQVYGETSDGSIRAKSTYFRKRFGRITYFGESVITESLENNVLAPTRSAWGNRSKEREQESSMKLAEQFSVANEPSVDDPTSMD